MADVQGGARRPRPQPSSGPPVITASKPKIQHFDVLAIIAARHADPRRDHIAQPLQVAVPATVM